MEPLGAAAILSEASQDQFPPRLDPGIQGGHSYQDRGSLGAVLHLSVQEGDWYGSHRISGVTDSFSALSNAPALSGVTKLLRKPSLTVSSTLDLGPE